MDKKQNVFEKLVQSLDLSERKSLLQKIAEIGEDQQNKDLLKHPNTEIFEGKPKLPDQDFLKESFLIQLWFRIRSFFSKSPPEELYSQYLVKSLGKKLSKNWSMYIDIRESKFTPAFAERLLELQKAQSFICSLLTAYKEDKGNFYILLGSLLIEESSAAIAIASNPFTTVEQKDELQNSRSTFLRKLEDAFSSINELDRSKMLTASQSIEWMKSFCDVHLDRMLENFSANQSVYRDCYIGTIANDLKTLARVLAHAKRINFLVLETLYLFSSHDKIEEQKLNIEKECNAFITVASSHFNAVRSFKNTIPLADFVRFATNDISWEIKNLPNTEDWFNHYKNAWKNQFEEHWKQWNEIQQSKKLENRILSLLQVKEIPQLLYMPWKDMWIPLTFRRELSIRFLKGFFEILYPQVLMKPLKIILIEGEFYKRDDLIEYTDSFNTLELMQQNIESFEARLGEKGDIGVGFNLLLREKMVTVKGKTRLENLMLTTNVDAEQLVTKAVQAFKTMGALLTRITGQKKTNSPGVLANIGSIQGRVNEQFRKEIIIVRQRIIDAQDILSEAGKIELKTV